MKGNSELFKLIHLPLQIQSKKGQVFSWPIELDKNFKYGK